MKVVILAISWKKISWSRSLPPILGSVFPMTRAQSQCCQSVGFYPNTTDFRCPNSGYGSVSVNLRIFFR